MAGRPSIYSDEIAVEICRRLAEGESLRSICRDDAMPCVSAVMKWLFDKRHPEFVEQYTRAREAQAEILADEIMEIADDGTNDWMERGHGANKGWLANGEAINRSRLRVDSRKWVASKLLPKKYGDFQHHEMSGPDGGPIETRDVNLIDLARRIAFLLTSAAEIKEIEGKAEVEP